MSPLPSAKQLHRPNAATGHSLASCNTSPSTPSALALLLVMLHCNPACFVLVEDGMFDEDLAKINAGETANLSGSLEQGFSGTFDAAANASKKVYSNFTKGSTATGTPNCKNCGSKTIHLEWGPYRMCAQSGDNAGLGCALTGCQCRWFQGCTSEGIYGRCQIAIWVWILAALVSALVCGAVWSALGRTKRARDVGDHMEASGAIGTDSAASTEARDSTCSSIDCFGNISLGGHDPWR